MPNFVDRSNRYPDNTIFRLSSWQPSVILDFKKFVTSMADRVSRRGSKCIIVPNFAVIGRTVPEIWPFFDFPRWRPPPSWILKILNLNGRTAQDGRSASPCQIWLKSVKTRPRYSDFSIFQDGGRRHLELLNLWNLNGRNAQKGQTASPCQISSKSVKPRPRYCDFSIFQDGNRRHLGFSKF